MIGEHFLSRHPCERGDTSAYGSEDRFELIANTAPVMIWMTDVDRLCTYLNKRWLDFTGRRIEKQLGNGWAEDIHPDDLRRCLDDCGAAFDRREPFQLEFRLRRWDGQFRWVLDSGVPRFDAVGNFEGYVGSAVDITEQKLAEATLSTISQQLIEAQEQERASIARELHDDVAQCVSLLAMQLRRLGNRTSLTEIREGIGAAVQKTTELGGKMRALSHRLHSPDLEYVGLEAAAFAYCSELAEQHHGDIRLHSQNVPRDLPREVSLCLFRIMQEALQNAIKHGGAQQFRVLLKGGNNEIELIVRDTGKGFEPAQVRKGHGLGLTSMRERLKPVNGTVSIESELGRGTTVHARVPLRRKVSAAKPARSRRR